MVRFEEEVVERYYNIMGYLTAKNIPYPSPAKRPGGKGRGEVDLLAVKLGRGRVVEDSVWCEVSVSVTALFPFICKKKPSVDEVCKLVRKFFSSGAEMVVAQYLSTRNYRYQLISSELSGRCKELLRDNMPSGSKLLSVRDTEWGIEVEHKALDPEIEVSGVRRIEVVPFSKILERLAEKFESKGFMEKDFADIIMRSIQHLAKQYRTRVKHLP
ncbi:MAG: hypothetical protein QXT26_07780 [Thermoproteota archaeon]